MEEKVTYDNRIFKYLRVAHDLKVKELADKFGVSHTYILRIESGEKKPSEKMLSLYCDTFGVTIRLLNYFQSEISEKEQIGYKFSCKEILLLILKVICNEKEI